MLLVLVGEGWCSWFYTPVCSYKFHALTVYLLSTFTVPTIGGACGIQSNICSGALLRRAPLCIFDRMFDRILNATLPKNLLWLEEGLRRMFPPLELYKGIFGSPCLLILLIYASNKENSSTTLVDKAKTCD